MNAKRPITIAIAAMFLIGGVAAVGAASPADAADQHATNASNGTTPEATTPNETAHDGENETAHDGENVSDERAGNADERAGNADERADTADGVGPNAGLPEQVPDRVGEIHDTIDSFRNGSIDGLGDSLSDLLSGEDAADGNADDATETDGSDATETDGSDATETDDENGAEETA
ncbi:hypothetical protein [Halopenitus persicus]|uniref:hypothetical protein n=1 Tax=Halopenitus persicus TaxID=1048396 RepID=UPI000BBA6D45|nr:hypothetical protein [Halopenitus persicus]